MARSIAFSLCRYAWTSLDEEAALSGSEQFATLQEIKGRPIAYRKKDASPDDETTFLFRPRKTNLHDVEVLTWLVADELKQRVRTKYMKEIDDFEDQMSATDEVKMSRFIAVPALGALAIDGRSGDRHLGAKSAAARMRALLFAHGDVDAVIAFAGSSQDVDRALTTWSLDHFDFTVRPSNPHPPKLGEQLDELMRRDNVGKFRGALTPANNEPIKVSKDGLIGEVTGLSGAGYGQFGASGTTPDGISATISSPAFDRNKEKNLKKQAENRVLKIHIVASESPTEEDSQVVRALLDLYGS